MSIYYIDLNKNIDDRFDMERFLAFENDVQDPITSFLLEKLKTLPVIGSFIISFQEGRPDLISYNIYRDVQYWWILMEFNDIVNRSDLVNGREINYFSLDNLEDIYYTLKASENTSNI
jgi:hypothetical protein